MPMDYAAALAYLDSFVNYERGALDLDKKREMNLDRVRELAVRLGEPQKRFPSVHVAGTKGKGSICAFCDATLRAAGLHTGLYTKPHLVDVRERIVCDGAQIAPADFARLLEFCRPHLEEMRARPSGTRRPTYFEILTHLGFLFFAERHVDAAVVETGVGGRLDATNILEPAVCGISNLSRDHMALLGGTLDLIAREKAGIFKPGVPAVSSPQIPEAAAALSDVAARVGAPLEFVGRELEVDVSAMPPAGDADPLPRAEAELRVPGEGFRVRARLGLAGRHQVENWAVAVRLAQLLFRRSRAAELPLQAIVAGARQVSWPGRLEEIQAWGGQPRLIIDGAHNDYSLETVLKELRAALPGRRPLVVLFACARDKDSLSMLQVLARRADEVVFTSIGTPRGVKPADLAALWRDQTGRGAAACALPAEGLAEARKVSGPGGLVVATGSLYLVGAVKRLFGAGVLRVAIPRRAAT